MNIAAKIPSSNEFFFPAVLKNLRKSEISNEESSDAEPLYIRFKAGYVPLGFVCALIAKLIAKDDFELLRETIIYKNKIEMIFKKVFIVTFFSCPRYCKIYAKKVPKTCNGDHVDHISVRKVLRESTYQVVDAMQHGSVLSAVAKCYDFAFKCPECCEQVSFGCETLAVVNSSSTKTFLECTKCPLRKGKLTGAMSIWYCRVSMHVCNCN